MKIAEPEKMWIQPRGDNGGLAVSLSLLAIVIMLAAIAINGCGGNRDNTTSSTVIECHDGKHFDNGHKHLCPPCEFRHCDEWIPPGQRDK